MRKFVDRSSEIRGINRTVRDNRVPFDNPRDIQNFCLPDKRLRRRIGYGSVHEPVKTQALCKSTGVSFSKRLVESDHNKGTICATPLSYGLIRWQSDYQLRRGESKTIEFCVRLGDKEELVKNTFARKADYAAAWLNYTFRDHGVYLLDQTLISNNHRFNTGAIVDNAINAGTTYDMGAFLLADQFDCLPLTSMSFCFNESTLSFIFGMVETFGAGTGIYREGKLQYSFPGGSYTTGDIYQVALVYDHTTSGGFIQGSLSLYINGLLEDVINIVNTTALAFNGEFDLINSISYATGQKRDIVLLNECTARGSYSSTCKVRGDMHGHQTFFHDFGNSANTGINPWALSPPRGTALFDLRIWNRAKSAQEVFDTKFIRVNDSSNSIKGNWYLNDGGPVCTNKVTGLEKRYCTIHHSYPGYVNESLMLGGIGIKLGEGQHIIKSITKNDRLFGSGFAAQLTNIFDDAVSATAFLKHRDQHSFSVMIQIMVPDAFQPELNDNAADPSTMRDLALVETRRAINTGCTADYDCLLDGTRETAAVARNFIGHATDPVPGPDINQHLRAYDQTLWSIEGTQLKDETVAATNESSRRRIPVARAVLTPQGKIAFELFKSQTGAAQPKYLRLLSASTLVVGSVYTITFVQRVNYIYDAPSDKLDARGWKMEIWLQNITAGTAVVLDSFHTVADGSTITTGSLAHDKNYDVSIGASYVNDGWDHSINMPFPAGVVATPKTSYVPPASTKRENHGPWPVQQRFMSPYQDQPGNFVIGMFRLWSLSIPDGLIKDFGNSRIASKDQTADLLVNLEITELSSVTIPNKSRYSGDVFELGYKSWGMPQGYRNFTYQTVNLSAFLKKELFEGTWAYEDCLGYMPITKSEYNALQLYTRVNGLAAAKVTDKQKYGVVSVYDDSIAFDDDLSGTFDPIFVSNHGLMSEFVPGQAWRGTVVSNKTILTAPNALPKVFDGKTLTVAGFKKWSGGTPIVYETATVPGGLVNGWYGVVLVYFSESRGIFHVSPVATVRVHSTNAIGIFMVPHHPDPRVTLIEVYRTIEQSTESLALSAPLFKTDVIAGDGTASTGIAGGNTFAQTLTISAANSALSGAVLDRNVTQFPSCAFSAFQNGRLYLGGNDLNPDTIFFCDAGNAERIDALFNNVVIPEATDVMTGMVAAFGTIFVFKPNSIWRIDDIGGNRHQVTQVSEVGAVSSRSILKIVNPDTGESRIFFWSQHGPFEFDGASARYIGAPIEESSSTLTSTPQYNWLNPSSVVVGHDAEAREIICFFAPVKPNNVGTFVELDRNGEAVVFNYRNRSWYRYNGTICTEALSLNLSVDSNVVDPTTRSLIRNEYRLFLGGTNGKIYSWGTDLQDGVPDGLSIAQKYPITASSQSNVFTIPTFPFTHDVIGCWLTVVYPSGDWFTAPIEFTQQSTTRVRINENWVLTSPGFVFGADPTGSIVYLCRPPAYVEFPWDELDNPYYEKDVKRLVLWNDAEAKYRFRHNYRNEIKFPWATVVDKNSLRNLIMIDKNVEAIKLEYASHELRASVDAIGYMVHYTESANTKQ